MLIEVFPKIFNIMKAVFQVRRLLQNSVLVSLDDHATDVYTVDGTVSSPSDLWMKNRIFVISVRINTAFSVPHN